MGRAARLTTALVLLGLATRCGARSELTGRKPAGAGGAASAPSAASMTSAASDTATNVSSSAASVAVSSSFASSASSVVSSSVASSSVASSVTSSSASSSSASSSTAASSGAGGAPATGCSDGTREGFVVEASHPAIAGCSGGWTVPGVLSGKPTCNRLAGDTSANPKGTGCSAEDLCAKGFHVCAGALDVAKKSPSGCSGAANTPGLFFATRQGSTGCAVCTLGMNPDPSQCTGCNCAQGCATNPTTANDVFGCGTLGSPPLAACGVLDRFSNNLCVDLGAPWSCGSDGCNEANAVTKPSPAGGGVLCCTD